MLELKVLKLIKYFLSNWKLLKSKLLKSIELKCLKLSLFSINDFISLLVILKVYRFPLSIITFHQRFVKSKQNL